MPVPRSRQRQRLRNKRASGIIKYVSFAGEMAVLYLYMRYRYNWNEVTFSMFSTFGMVTNLIGKKIISERDAIGSAREEKIKKEKMEKMHASARKTFCA